MRPLLISLGLLGLAGCARASWGDLLPGDAPAAGDLESGGGAGDNPQAPGDAGPGDEALAPGDAFVPTDPTPPWSLVVTDESFAGGVGSAVVVRGNGLELAYGSTWTLARNAGGTTAYWLDTVGQQVIGAFQGPGATVLLEVWNGSSWRTQDSGAAHTSGNYSPLAGSVSDGSTLFHHSGVTVTDVRVTTDLLSFTSLATVPQSFIGMTLHDESVWVCGTGAYAGEGTGTLWRVTDPPENHGAMPDRGCVALASFFGDLYAALTSLTPSVQRWDGTSWSMALSGVGAIHDLFSDDLGDRVWAATATGVWWIDPEGGTGRTLDVPTQTVRRLTSGVLYAVPTGSSTDVHASRDGIEWEPIGRPAGDVPKLGIEQCTSGEARVFLQSHGRLYESVPFASTGTFTTTPYDLLSPRSGVFVSVVADVPAGTSVRTQALLADDAGGPYVGGPLHDPLNFSEIRPGRFLKLSITLGGDGRSTPRVHEVFISAR